MEIKIGVNTAVESPKRNKNRIYRAVKRLFDIFLSVLLLVLLSPFFLLFTAIIFLYDLHNPFYMQERVGRYGKKFRIIKFRSMRKDAEDFDKYFSEDQKSHFENEYKIDDDPRITPVGRFIRKFSIDELPQLLNVLSGKMSMIGPRPLTEKETYFFGEDRELLLSVTPGITGLWQVSGRNALTYESGERQKCELTYVRSFGFKMDLKVFCKTFAVILGGSGK